MIAALVLIAAVLLVALIIVGGIARSKSEEVRWLMSGHGNLLDDTQSLRSEVGRKKDQIEGLQAALEAEIEVNSKLEALVDDLQHPIDTIVRDPQRSDALDALVAQHGGERPALIKMAQGFDWMERKYVEQDRLMQQASALCKQATEKVNAHVQRIKDLENFLRCANVKKKKYHRAWKRAAKKVNRIRDLELTRDQLQHVNSLYDNLVNALIDKKDIVVNPIYRIAYARAFPPAGLPKGL